MRPVEKPVNQPIRLLHELLFLPHLMHYFKKSDDPEFKWRLVAQLNEDVLAVRHNNVSNFFPFEDCFAEPKSVKENAGHVIGRLRSKYLRAFRDFPDLIINVSADFNVIV